jgi:hypothetical protein
MRVRKGRKTHFLLLLHALQIEISKTAARMKFALRERVRDGNEHIAAVLHDPLCWGPT